MNWLRRFLLWLVFGKSYDYMARSVAHDPRTARGGDVDIITRDDGIEVRVEADWVKTIAKIVATPERRAKAKAYRDHCKKMGY